MPIEQDLSVTIECNYYLVTNLLLYTATKLNICASNHGSQQWGNFLTFQLTYMQLWMNLQLCNPSLAAGACMHVNCECMNFFNGHVPQQLL